MGRLQVLLHPALVADLHSVVCVAVEIADGRGTANKCRGSYGSCGKAELISISRADCVRGIGPNEKGGCGA